MSFDFQKILASKKTLRRKLAARPVAEKLRMLDDLRARALAIRHTTPHPVSPGPLLRAAPTLPVKNEFERKTTE